MTARIKIIKFYEVRKEKALTKNDPEVHTDLVLVTLALASI
jgi:hypothetical protein